MKKTLFALLALIFVSAIALSSCKKTTEDEENPTPVELTFEEKLTQKEGWIMTSATSEPEYIASGGTSADLFKYFFYACELGDVTHYKLTPKKEMWVNSKCDVATGKDIFMGDWDYLNADSSKVSFYLAAYFDESTDKYFELPAKIVTLTDDKLIIKVELTEEVEEAAKAKGPNHFRGLLTRGELRDYNFTIQYKLAK